MEIRDLVADEFLICFIHTDETYRRMAHRDLLEGTLPQKENEIAADGFVLSNLGFSGDLGDSLRIGEKDYIVTGILKSEWAASSSEMEVFVSDSFIDVYKGQSLYRSIKWLSPKESPVLDGVIYKMASFFNSLRSRAER